MENYFVVENLTKKFRGGAGVENVSFKADHGQIIGFLGANGAGKTTTIRLIFGLLKRKSGTVTLNGKDVLKGNILEKIAFFPDQNNYPVNYKIEEYIIYNAELSGISKKEIAKKTNEILEALNLEENRKQTFKKLSAGMQKRALLASTLITDPEIIILDEPTANLDVNSRVDFLQTLVSLAKRGVTIIITSHIIAELQEIIDHLLIMKDGKIVYDNSFNNKKEKIQDVYSKFYLDGSKINIDNLDNILSKKGSN